MSIIHTFLIAAWGMVFMTNASAQAYPAKPVRMVISTAAGGSADTIGRIVAAKMAESLGQQIIVDNRTGSAGVVATSAVAKSVPDGYTLLLAYGSHVINPSIYPKLPYDPSTDFTPVVMTGQFNSVMVANIGVPANSFRELLMMAKAKPGAISWGASGSNGTSNMYAEWFRHAMNIDFYNVPYKNNVQTLAATASGEIQATLFALGGASGQAKAGKVKILAAISEQRLSAMPGLPTVQIGRAHV
mgnify:CR=1 FL=1